MKQRREMARRGLLALAAATAACTSAGKDNVLFITRTNIGIDLDATPAATDIGYSREEFVLSPIFEESQVLPVMTTVGTSANVLDFTADQSFATGEAALILADAFVMPTDYVFLAHAEANPTSSPFVKAPTTSSQADYWSGRIRTKKKNPDDRDLYFFGTDTDLGLHVEWTGGTTPTSVSLGYKRKELACIPLIENDVDAETVEVRLPSLIATAASGAKVGGKEDTGISVHQSYATGAAATLLVRHRELRLSTLPALVSNFDSIAQQLADKATGEAASFDKQEEVAEAIMAYFKDNKSKPAALNSMLSAARKALGDQSVTEANFDRKIALWVAPENKARFKDLEDLLAAMKVEGNQ